MSARPRLVLRKEVTSSMTTNTGNRRPLLNHQIWAVLLLVLALFALHGGRLEAITVSPELRHRLEKEGQWQQFAAKLTEWHSRLDNQASPINIKDRFLAKSAHGQAAAPETLKVCVLMVDFVDNVSSWGAQSSVTPAVVDQILFAPGGSGLGSMTDFYLENSYGQLYVDGEVYGWYRMPRSYSTYVGSDYGLQAGEPNARTLVKDAIAIADPNVNYAQFDNDGDGFVEAIFVLHAGPGAEETGSASHMWSHRWNAGGQVQTADGVKCFNYVAVPEEVLGGAPRIGVFAHEFGHILGLPDLYDIGHDPSRAGIGRWSLMASGSWNFGQRKPANFDAWSKHVLDSLHGTFGRTIDLTGNLTDVVLRSAVIDSIRYRYKLPSASGREYFLIENRQQEGFDQYLPGAGLLIYHCDDNLTGSNNTNLNSHLRISLEQADGYGQLELDINEGDSEDPFPGVAGEKTEFTSLSRPSTDSWYGTPHQFSIWDIRHDTDEKTVTCNFDVSYSRSRIVFLDFGISDLTSGNGNDIFEPGEIIQASFSVTNYWMTASNVTATLSCSTPGVTIMNPSLHIPAIGGGQTLVSPAPFNIQLSPALSPTIARFDLRLASAFSPDTFLTSFQTSVGGINVVLIDADDSPFSAEMASYYAVALDSILCPVTYWDIATQGPPPASLLDYSVMVWFTGSIRSQLAHTISSGEVAYLRSYLDQGGHLLLTGQDIAEQLTQTADSTFLRDYLGVRYLDDLRPYDADVLNESPIGAGWKLRVAGSQGASNQLDTDLLEVLPGSTPAFQLKSFDGTETGIGGVTRTLPNNGQVVFLSFGIEAVTTSHANLGYATRYQLLQAAIDFLREDIATDANELVDVKPLPFDFELQQNYPNPFNPSTTIQYVVSPRVAGQPLSLEVYNILGQRVASLIEATAASGSYRLDFDAGQLASGIYLYRLQIGNQTITRKMILSK